MAAYVKFNQFVEDLAHGVHNLSTGAATVALTTAANAPVATFTQLWPDLVLTASGAVATFRYVVIYNDTPTSPADPLICYYDYGSDLTLASGETLTIDFTTSSFTIA